MLRTLRKNATTVAVALVTAVVVGGTLPAAAHITTVRHTWTQHFRPLADARYWKLAGNAGTTGTNFVGTTDNKPLVFKVNRARALRLEPNATSPNVIGGFRGNSVTPGAHGAIIGGGGESTFANRVTDDYGTVGGGRNNHAGNDAGTTSDAFFATVGGGQDNTASGPRATVAGGRSNSAGGDHGTIGGGLSNTAAGNYSTVAGGTGNTAQGGFAAVAGGSGNSASADYASVAGGLTNQAGGTYATVGGGFSNTANGGVATVGGGVSNSASGSSATISGGNTNAASADKATVGGGQSNAASSTYATVGGGQSNTATADHSTVGGGQLNSAQGQFATVAGGQGTRALSSYATAAGGESNTASTAYSTVGGGSFNLALGQFGTVSGGQNNSATGSRSIVPGGLAANATLFGQMAHASGAFSADGDAQASEYVLRRTTTDATPTELFLDGSSARLTIPSGRTMSFDALVVARTNDAGGKSAGYKVTGLIENVGGTVGFVGTPTVTVLGEDDPAWDLAVQADDTNDALVFKATGAASTTIRWVAMVKTSEVLFP